MGEIVTAFIVAKDPTLAETDLETWCRNSDTLANYKRPRRYIFCNDLPRNASGKIQKFLLRKQLEENVDGKSLGTFFNAGGSSQKAKIQHINLTHENQLRQQLV